MKHWNRDYSMRRYDFSFVAEKRARSLAKKESGSK
jgi:hypothetical protein